MFAQRNFQMYEFQEIVTRLASGTTGLYNNNNVLDANERCKNDMQWMSKQGQYGNGSLDTAV